MLKITKQNNLISLDISTKSTGYAIFHSSGSLITSGVLTSKHSDFLVRGNSMADEIQALVEEYEVTQAVIEELKVLKNQKTLTRLAIVQGLIIRGLKKCSIDFVSPSVWRSKYSIPRERDKAKKRALELVEGILPNGVTDDEAEAYLIGKYFIKNIKNGVDR